MRRILVVHHRGRSRNKKRAYKDFSVEARPATHSFTHRNKQQAMEGRLDSLKQSMHSLTMENQQLMARITKSFEMMAARDQREAGEKLQRRLQAGDEEDF